MTLAILDPTQADLVEVLEEFLDLARQGVIVGIVGVYIERDGNDYDIRPAYLGDVTAGWETTYHRLGDIADKLKMNCDWDEEWAGFLVADEED
jgi:hypothetical protein